MLPPQIRKFDIVEQLGSDEDGSRLREVIQRLQKNREHYKHRMDQGVGSGDLKELAAVVSAYDAALNALPDLWREARQDWESGNNHD